MRMRATRRRSCRRLVERLTSASRCDHHARNPADILDHDEAYATVDRLLKAVPSGSYFAITDLNS